MPERGGAHPLRSRLNPLCCVCCVVVALCVLKGGFQYFADVCDNLKRHAAAHYPEAIQFNMDFIRLKSYEGSFKGKTVTYLSILQMTVRMRKCK